MPTPTPRVSVRTRRVALACIAVFTCSVVVTGAIVSYLQRQPQVQRINYSQLYSLAEAGGATALTVDGETVTVTRPDGSIVEATVPATAPQNDVVQLFRKNNVPVEFRPLQPGLLANVMNWGLPILMLGLIAVAAWRIYASMSGRGSFELADHNGQQDVGFNDVAGVDEAKAELTETIEFLRNPERFSRLGGRIPKGILLFGPPGTGKTLLARAVAGEAGVPFFSINGSEFIQMFVGVGASRGRDLFRTAKENSPCLLFIDEIDAVGRMRGAGVGGGSDEREQTLNQILSEMDGFTPNEMVIVIAATNRPDVLDSALLRPGRFDRHVTIDRPTWQGRLDILKVHTRNKPLGDDVNLEEIARKMIGMTGADLRNLANEAALLASRENKSRINRSDFENAADRVLMGPKREEVLNQDEKRRTAYHEAGHA